MKQFILIDCNNFFVSCERVFNPKLLNKPVVVLSSNDACIIARSNEAKALGIPMGAPEFSCRNIIKKNNVIVLSANFTLYGDMSNRIMQILSKNSSDLEIYSIDEAFLHMKLINKTNLEYGFYLKDIIKKQTGIPISVGIGSTKTLAKIANRIAKKEPKYQNVCDLNMFDNIDNILSNISVEDIWGIGYRYANKLKNYGIFTVKDFKYANENWIKKNLTVIGYKSQLEIKGFSYLKIDNFQSSKKSITVSRSFGKIVSTIDHLKEATAQYISMAAEKLRNQKSAVLYLTVFTLSRQPQEIDYKYDNQSCELPIATFYTPDLITYSHKCLKKLFKPGFLYKKVGVIFSNIISNQHIQTTISNNNLNNEKQTKIMNFVDTINSRLGKDTIRFAASGISQEWQMKQSKKSQCFSTNWHEILTIKA